MSNTTPKKRTVPVVPDSTSADDANKQYGERYGMDWVYESKPNSIGEAFSKFIATSSAKVASLELKAELFKAFMAGGLARHGTALPVQYPNPKK